MALFLALLSGVLQATAFSQPELWWAVWASPALLAWALTEVSREGRSIPAAFDAFRIGYLQGQTFFALLIWWLVPTIGQYGGLPLAASVVICAGLVAYLALYPGLWALLVTRRGPDWPVWPLWAAAVWTLLEWIRGWLFTGFPWGALGYGVAPVPGLMASASVWGLWGVTFLVAWVALGAFQLVFLWRLSMGRQIVFSLQRVFGALLQVILPLMLLTTVCSDVESGRGVMAHRASACAIQGAFDQWRKWAPALRRQTVDTYIGLSMDAVSQIEAASLPGETILVWPETAMPFYLQEDSNLRGDLEALAQGLGLCILTGSPAYEREEGLIRYFNSAWIVGPKGISGPYSKRHLVPFGEYLPLGPLEPFVREMVPAAGDFSAGTSSKPLSCGPFEVGVLVCFESIFPELARQEVLAGANVLAVITNDSWFGDTPAPWQHAAMARFRAVETGRWVIRAANTGISQLISPQGRVVSSGRLFTPDVVCSAIELRSGQTFFVRHGSWWFIACASVIILTGYLPLLGRSFKVEGAGTEE